MNVFTLLLLLGSFEPSPLDLLETGLLLQWSELPFMAGSGSRIILDGDPVMLSDSSVPLPPWGSFEGVELLSPLESGIWGGGRWTTEFTTAGIPDSSYRSMVGLLENTVGRNRYSGLLQRPLPLGVGLGASLGREDTLSTQLLRLEREPFSIGSFMWQTDEDGYSSRASFNRGGFRASAGIASVEEGSRVIEGLASAGIHSGRLMLEAAAGASAWDTLSMVEGHVRTSVALGPASLIVRGDLERDSGGVEVAGTAGLLYGFQGGLRMGAAYTGIPGQEHGFLATAVWGVFGAEFTASGTGTAGGIHLSWPAWLRASAFVSDSLRRAALSVFPGIRYGANGLVNLGGRIEATDPVSDDGNDDYTVEADLCASLRILGFSLVGSVEDVFDDSDRRASYGLVWFFSDPPAWQPGEEEGER